MATVSSEIIPRERLSAWQRWELAALASAPGPTPADADSGSEPKLVANAEAILDTVREQARAAGYAEGQAAAQEERALLAELATRLGAATRDVEQARAEQVLELALVLARQFVGTAIAVRRDLVLPALQQALRELPDVTQRIEVVLHPVDLPVIASHLDAGELAAQCQLVPDPTVAPGGCRVVTSQCEIDATLPSRWNRLMTALGRTDDWIAHA